MRIVTGLAAVLAATCLASAAQALTIVSTFDSSITSRSDAADIEATISTATAFYKAFSDPIAVNITFRIGDTHGDLARSLTSLYSFDYADYQFGLGLQASLHPENAILQSAVANLGFGNTADVVVLSSANLNALVVPFGITFPGFVDGAQDGEVTLSDVPGTFAFSGPVGPAQYDPLASIQHEVNEVLGIGGDYLAYLPPGLVGALDLDRYNGLHSPSLDPTQPSYFSYDGGQTVVRDYNQVAGGDYSDWAKTTCAGAANVQDVVACPGGPHVAMTRGSPEARALQAIGYNLAAVPEPSSWALMIGGFGLAGVSLRRRKTVTA